MSVDSVLDGAFTILLAKAQKRQLDADLKRGQLPASAVFEWTGGGVPLVLTSMDPVLLEVPFPSRIVWAHLYAFSINRSPASVSIVPVAVTATVDVRLTSFDVFGASVPLYGTGAIPSLTAAASASLDVTLWQQNLLAGDTLVAGPVTFVGTAPCLALVLQLRPTEEAIGVVDVVDSSAGGIVDAAGNPVVLRS